MSEEIAAGPLAWGGLLALLIVMIVIDLRVGSAQRSMTVRTAAIWSGIWIALSVAFGAGLWVAEGAAAGEAYFAGYVMEKALSLDNVFVFTLIFSALAVPREEQPRVLLWGILIALVLRGIFIFAGAEALESYSWVAWPFAALLAWTGWRILRSGEEHDEGAQIVERVRRRFPGLRPAVAALVAVAVADVIFAVDSVPAILAITTDTFIVFAANAFALLGLRALFFLVAGAVARFAYLKLGLGVLLIGIAGKLAYGEATGEKIATSLTLGSIVAVLAAAIGASVLKERRLASAP
ncbi:MAG TPA: TerC family protein [Solirubrobacteraceae bacterium]|nr:TerC family protein [Solirubrobacteraceae bacterium]